MSFLDEIHSNRIDLYLHQQGIDTTTPAGKALFQMCGVFAEFERAMIQERVKAGLARARAQGKVLGRPRVSSRIEPTVRALRAKGKGIHAIAREAGVGVGTCSAHCGDQPCGLTRRNGRVPYTGVLVLTLCEAHCTCSSVTRSISPLPFRGALPELRCVSSPYSAWPRANAVRGGHQTTSPGRITSIGPPQLCTRPQPDVTMSVCPSGCVCQLLRAHGSNVTYAPLERNGSAAVKSGSTRTLPVKYSADPLAEGLEPFREMSTCKSFVDDYMV